MCTHDLKISFTFISVCASLSVSRNKIEHPVLNIGSIEFSIAPRDSQAKVARKIRDVVDAMLPWMYLQHFYLEKQNVVGCVLTHDTYTGLFPDIFLDCLLHQSNIFPCILTLPVHTVYCTEYCKHVYLVEVRKNIFFLFYWLINDDSALLINVMYDMTVMFCTHLIIFQNQVEKKRV